MQRFQEGTWGMRPASGFLAAYRTFFSRARKLSILYFLIMTSFPISFMKGGIKLTPAARDEFIRILAQTGLYAHSAACVGVSAQTIRLHRKKDPEFDARVAEAMDYYRDSLVREAHRRAVDGISDDVYFQGAVVGQRKTYSDRLMELLLKRHIPEFRDHVTQDVNVSGGVLVVGRPPSSPEEWESIYSARKEQLGHEGHEGHELPGPDGAADGAADKQGA